MALGTPTLLVGSGAAAATHTTAGVTPAAACRLHAHVNLGASAADPTLPTFSDSTGLGWTKFYDYTFSTGSNPRLRQVGFWADVISPALMTFTAAATGAAAVHIQVAQQTGSFSSDYTNQSNGQDLTAGDPSVTLPNAAISTNTVYSSCFAAGSSTNAKPASYTNLQDSTLTTARRSSLCYDNTSPAQTIAWTSANLATQAVAYEAKEATGSVNGSLSGTIDPVTQTATGTVTIQGSLGQTIDAFTLSASGSHSTVTGSLAQTIDPVTQTTTGTLTIQGSMAQTIAPVTQATTGALVIQGSFGQTIDPVTLAANGTSGTPAPANEYRHSGQMAAVGRMMNR